MSDEGPLSKKQLREALKREEARRREEKALRESGRAYSEEKKQRKEARREEREREEQKKAEDASKFEELVKKWHSQLDSYEADPFEFANWLMTLDLEGHAEMIVAMRGRLGFRHSKVDSGAWGVIFKIMALESGAIPQLNEEECARAIASFSIVLHTVFLERIGFIETTRRKVIQRDGAYRYLSDATKGALQAYLAQTQDDLTIALREFLDMFEK